MGYTYDQLLKMGATPGGSAGATPKKKYTYEELVAQGATAGEAPVAEPKGPSVSGNIPVVKQLSQAGVGIGSALGKFALGVPEAAVRLAGPKVLKDFGYDPSLAGKAADKIKDVSNKIYDDPFRGDLDSTSGKVGTVVGNVIPYALGAGEVNAATKALPFATRVLARTAPDVALSLAQSGGDVKTAGATGVASAAANAIIPGPNVSGFLPRTKQVIKEVAPGYISDVAGGMAGQRGEDRTGGAAFIPGAGTALSLGVAGATRGVGTVNAIRNRNTQEGITKRVEEELVNIENNYSKIRKAKGFSKDEFAGSRSRVVKTGVLNDAVNTDGHITTKGKGGAAEQYRSMTIDGQEGVVREGLQKEGARVHLDDVESELIRAVNASGLEGDDLRAALAKVKGEVAGYRLKANPDGTIPLTLVHDAKISTTRNIDYNTPAETKTYRKSIARGLKTIVEKKSSTNVKEINAELKKYYDDIAYLESLDGRKVKGGKLGKYTAQIAGNIVGGVAGSLGGPIGTTAGAVIGGEVASGIKGRALSGTLAGVKGVAPERSTILQNAQDQARAPLLALPAPRPGTPRVSLQSGKPIRLLGAGREKYVPKTPTSGYRPSKPTETIGQKQSTPPKKVFESLPRSIPESKPKGKLPAKPTSLNKQREILIEDITDKAKLLLEGGLTKKEIRKWVEQQLKNLPD